MKSWMFCGLLSLLDSLSSGRHRYPRRVADKCLNVAVFIRIRASSSSPSAEVGSASRSSPARSADVMCPLIATSTSILVARSSICREAARAASITWRSPEVAIMHSASAREPGYVMFNSVGTRSAASGNASNTSLSGYGRFCLDRATRAARRTNPSDVRVRCLLQRPRTWRRRQPQ